MESQQQGQCCLVSIVALLLMSTLPLKITSLEIQQYSQQYQSTHPRRSDQFESYITRSTTTLSYTDGNVTMLKIPLDGRYLAVGDYESFNQQIKDLRIALPDTEANQNALDLKVSNIECTSINIGDINPSWQLYGNGSADVTTGYAETLGLVYQVAPFGVTCSANYEYTALGFLRGRGSLKAISSDSTATFRFDFNSVGGFANDFPTNLDVHTCQTSINVADIEFDGTGFGSNLLNLAENLISNIVEDQANKITCQKLTELIPDAFNPKLVNASQNLLNITGDIDIDDPMQVEEDYVPSTNATLVNFQLSSSDVQNTTSNNVTFFSAEKLILLAIEEVKNEFEGTASNGSLKAVDIIQSFVNDQGMFELNFTSGDGSTLGDSLFSPTLVNISDPVGTVITLQSIRVSGLDSLTTFEILNPIGKYTLENTIQWNQLVVEVDLQIIIQPSTSPDQSILYSPVPMTIMENVTVTLSLEQPSIAASVFAPIDTTKIGSLMIGNFLDTKNILPCILSVLDDFKISGLVFSYSNSQSAPISATGFSNPGLQRVATTTIEALLAAFEPTFTKMLPGWIRRYFYDAYNQGCPTIKSSSAIATKSGSVTPTKDNELTPYIDFRDLLLTPSASKKLGGSGKSPYGDVVRLVYSLIIEDYLYIDKTSKLATELNKLISQQFATNGNYLVQGDLINQDSKISAGGLEANIQIRAYDAYIKNINTVGAPLSLLEPTKGNANTLNNTAAFGVNDEDIILGMKLLIGLQNDETNIRNEFDVSIGMDALSVVATVLMKMSFKEFSEFPLRDISNLNCWLATIPAPVLDEYGVRDSSTSEETMGIVEFKALLDSVKLNVTCRNCTGPLWSELSTSLAQNQDKVTDTARRLVDFATDLVKGEYLAVQIARWLNDAPKLCPHNPQYNQSVAATTYKTFELEQQEDSVSFLFALLTITGSILAAILLIFLTTRIIVRRRHKKWLQSLSQNQLNMLYQQQEEKGAAIFEMNNTTKSLFRSPSLPLWVRYFMPLVILGNIGFFLSGHLSLGGSVSILISLGGQTLRNDDFFQFSMAKSTIEIWNAGGQALAIMIFLASFAWPYSKSIISLVLWFMPTRFCSVSTRGSILLWLDALAKWSMVDIFVLVATIVCLKVQIKSPTIDYLPEGLYQVDLLVVPKWGLYANMIAQLICQISSHYMIYYHRRIISDSLNRQLQVSPTQPETSFGFEDEMAESVVSDPPKTTSATEQYLLNQPAEKLCNHAFRRAHRAEKDKLVVRCIVAPLVIATALVTTTLIVLGCVMPTFSINILGLVGVLVESGQGFMPADTNYSMFGMLQMLFAQAQLTGTPRDYIGLGSLSFIVVATVLCVPIAQLIALLVQWFMSMNMRQRKRLSLVIEILQAWQYMEVYLLSVVVAAWQLGPISEFIVNPFCKSLRGFFAQLVFYGIMKEEDAQCLKTDINVAPTFYLLFVAAICLHLLNTFIVNAVNQYNRDLENNKNCFYNEDLKARTLQELLTFESDNIGEFSASKDRIKPVPVLYTDKFRWLLRRHDTTVAYINPDVEQEQQYDDASLNQSYFDGSKMDCASPIINQQAPNVFRRTSDEESSNDQEANNPNQRFLNDSKNDTAIPSFENPAKSSSYDFSDDQNHDLTLNLNRSIFNNRNNDSTIPTIDSPAKSSSYDFSDDQSNDVVSLNQNSYDFRKLEPGIPTVSPSKSPGILPSNSDDDSFDAHFYDDKEYDR